MIGRRKEPILGYVPKNDEKKNSVHKGLMKMKIFKYINNPGGHWWPLSPKFQFYFRKGSSKKKRRAYESVDEKSLS